MVPHGLRILFLRLLNVKNVFIVGVILYVVLWILVLICLCCNSVVINNNSCLICFDMCTNQRFVVNRYTHSSFLAKCGHCPACQQEKAYKRSYRIKCETSPQTICLFVTLTYDRASCPFVFQSDLDARKDILPVYREYFTRRVPVKTSKGIKYLSKRYFENQKLSEIVNPDYESFDYRGSKLPHLKYRTDKVGICYFPDLQNFKKRLSINLKRKYDFQETYKVFACSEYGETTSRPHFHLLFFIRPNDETLFRTAISEAWPFASHGRTEKYIEIARDCANYVASYVNCGSRLHPFLSKNFKQKHSYSKDFGMSDKLFSLDSILSKVEKRDLSYLRGVGPKGMEQYVNFPIPKYVVNRYFPLFKGFSRFTDLEVLDVLRCFVQPETKQPKTPLISLSSLLSIEYTKEDLHKICVRLTNAYNKYANFCVSSGRSPSVDSYIYVFRDAWRVYKNTQLRLWYEDDSCDWKYKFDNTQALGLLNAQPTYEFLASTPARWIDNPNDYPQVRNMTIKYAGIFDFRCKEKKINNYVMSQNNYYF